MLVMENEFIEVFKEFNNLPALRQNMIIKKVTKKRINPTIQGYIKNLCGIENMGIVAAIEVIFKIGVKLQ